MWPFLLSSSENPLRILLELILTKIDILFGTQIANDNSFEVEGLSPCLRGKVVQDKGRLGWKYIYDKMSESELKKRGSRYEFEPLEINDAQNIIITHLCREDSIELNDPEFIEFASKEPGGVDEFVEKLVDTGLVAITANGLELVLTTMNCCVVIYQDKYYAGENNAGQMANWIQSKLTNP